MTEGLLAALVEELREQSTILRRIEASLFTLRLIIGVVIFLIMVFGIRVSFK